MHGRFSLVCPPVENLHFRLQRPRVLHRRPGILARLLSAGDLLAQAVAVPFERLCLGNAFAPREIELAKIA